MSGTTGSPSSPAAQVVQAADFASPVAVGKAVTRRDVETLWTTKPSIIYSTKEKTWLVARSVANKSRGTFTLAFAKSGVVWQHGGRTPRDVLPP